MTSLAGSVRGAPVDHSTVTPGSLPARLSALAQFLQAAGGHLPDDRLVPAHTVVERAGQRLALSSEHTVVALAGSTGSGKSSLFNTLARMHLSPVGFRRPTTSVTHACVWGPPAPANGLLDWLGVLPRHRFTRESALDGEDEAALRGLVLLDLPDFDSVELTHRAEVERLLGLVDLIVWVVDPQKYADRVVHEGFLRQLRRQRDVTVVALNHADRLAPADLQRCLADLRRLVAEDGLPSVPVLATSAVGPPGIGQLRVLLERVVADRQAALSRLDADLDRVLADLSTVVGPTATEAGVDEGMVRSLTDALARAAGVRAVIEATDRAYRRRAAAAMAGPLARLPVGGRAPVRPIGAEAEERSLLLAGERGVRAAADLAVRMVADRASGVLPPPWPTAITAAARSRLDDLPGQLRNAVAGRSPYPLHPAWWWRLVGAGQWLAGAGALIGALWVVTDALVDLHPPIVGGAPLPALLVLASLGLGLLLFALPRALVGMVARRAAGRADAQLREAVAAIAHEHVIALVREVLEDYQRAWAALVAAGAPR